MKKVPLFEYYPDTTEIPLTLTDGTRKTVGINPGWAFGKGFHSTTKLCIEALERLFSDPDIRGSSINTMLDVGCGSGVLSICAAMLGAKKVTGLDIEIIIVNEARANVSKNGFEREIDIVLGGIEDIQGSFDLVAANILVGSMLPMKKELKDRLNPSGLLLLSGIKEIETDAVEEEFSKLGLSLLEKETEKEWVALLFRAPAAK